MNRIWKKWLPRLDIFSKFYIESIDNNTEGFFITLKNDMANESITVIIDTMCFSYRSTPTKYCLNKIEKLKQKKELETWSLFEIENSDYLKWVQEESHGIYESSENYKIKHYIFAGTNIIFEVLMHEPDTLKVVK